MSHNEEAQKGNNMPSDNNNTTPQRTRRRSSSTETAHRPPTNGAPSMFQRFSWFFRRQAEEVDEDAEAPEDDEDDGAPEDDEVDEYDEASGDAEVDEYDEAPSAPVTAPKRAHEAPPIRAELSSGMFESDRMQAAENRGKAAAQKAADEEAPVTTATAPKRAHKAPPIRAAELANDMFDSDRTQAAGETRKASAQKTLEYDEDAMLRLPMTFGSLPGDDAVQKRSELILPDGLDGKSELDKLVASDNDEPLKTWGPANNSLLNEMRERVEEGADEMEDEIESWSNVLTIFERFQSSSPQALEMWTQQMVKAVEKLTRVHNASNTLAQLIIPVIERLKDVAKEYQDFNVKKAVEEAVAGEIHKYVDAPLAEIERAATWRAEQFSNFMIEWKGTQLYKSVEKKCNDYIASLRTKMEQTDKAQEMKMEQRTQEYEGRMLEFIASAETIAEITVRHGKSVEKGNENLKESREALKQVQEQSREALKQNQEALERCEEALRSRDATITNLHHTVATLSEAVENLRDIVTNQAEKQYITAEGLRYIVESRLDWDSYEQDDGDFEWAAREPPAPAPPIHELGPLPDFKIPTSIPREPAGAARGGAAGAQTRQTAQANQTWAQQAANYQQAAEAPNRGNDGRGRGRGRGRRGGRRGAAHDNV